MDVHNGISKVSVPCGEYESGARRNNGGIVSYTACAIGLSVAMVT